MTTTTQTLPTHDHTGRALRDAPESYRTYRGIVLRSEGRTWAEVAAELGYATPGHAERAVMRCVAWLNGNHSVTPRTRRSPQWALTRSFGVEIEFVGATMFTVARAIESVVGYEVRVENYHAEQNRARRGDTVAYGQWKCEYDGSVTSRGRGGEVVSPVLHGREGLDQLKAVMQAMRNVGARVSVRTGMHVHVDARDLTGEQIARLISAYADRQTAFDQFVSPSRQSITRNHYCMALGEGEKARIVEQFKATKSAPYGADRYRTVNCTSYAAIGTIEFRQHHGTLNGSKAVAWIETLLALTNSVLATEDESLPTTATEMVDALTAFGMTAAAARQMKGRVR